MLTTTGSARTYYADLTRNSDSVHLDAGERSINEYTRTLLAERPWPFMRREATAIGDIQNQFIDVPYDMGLFEKVYTTILGSDTKYIPDESPNQDHWDFVSRAGTSVSSSIPEWTWRRGSQIGFSPTLNASAVVHFVYQKRYKDNEIDSYTAGTVHTLEAGSTIVSGTNTNWSTRMNDAWIRVDGDFGTATGDNVWYEINEVNSTSEINLLEPYRGGTISSGSATYTIADISPVPEDYQSIPIRRAAAEYLYGIDDVRAQRQDQIADNLHKEMISTYGAQSNRVTFPDEMVEFINPNLTIRDISGD